MAVFSAKIYLQRPGAKTAFPIGEKPLQARPVQGGQIAFEHGGKMELGRVDWIDPQDWERQGVVPTIKAVQSPGE